MKLSPFFANKNRKSKSKSSGIKKVDKFLEDKKFFKNIYKHHQEVDMILLMALIKKYGENFLDEIIKAKLTDKRLKKFFNKEMVDFLVEEGCDELQGYYYYKPMSQESFDQLLQKTF